MKAILLLLSLLCCTAVSAQDSWRRVLMDMAPGCRIQMSVPIGAQAGFGKANRGSGGVSIEHPPRTTKLPYRYPLTFTFICYDAADDLTAQDPVRFDHTKNKWVRDMRPYFDRFPEGLPPQRQKIFDRAILFHELQTVNAQGFAFTEDDLAGDESGRRRQMSYCIFHMQKAICGESTMALISMIRQHPGNDLTPLALRILRSIEFLDDHDTGSRPDPAASGPAQAQAGAR